MLHGGLSDDENMTANKKLKAILPSINQVSTTNVSTAMQTKGD